MAKKPTPKVTQKHVDNANEIAQILKAMKGAGAEEAQPQERLACQEAGRPQVTKRIAS